MCGKGRSVGCHIIVAADLVICIWSIVFCVISLLTLGDPSSKVGVHLEVFFQILNPILCVLDCTRVLCLIQTLKVFKFKHFIRW